MSGNIPNNRTVCQTRLGGIHGALISAFFAMTSLGIGVLAVAQDIC